MNLRVLLTSTAVLIAACGPRQREQPGSSVLVRTLPAVTALTLRSTPPLAAARAAVPAAVRELEKLGVIPAGTPFLVTGESLYEACVPVPAGTGSPDTARFRSREFGPMTIASVAVAGTRPETTVTRLLDWLAENSGYRVAGPVVEFYPPGSDWTEVGIVVAPAEP